MQSLNLITDARYTDDRAEIMHAVKTDQLAVDGVFLKANQSTGWTKNPDGDRVYICLQGSGELAVPVVQQGRLTGVASATDIAVAVATGKGLEPISAISKSVVETLPADATLEQAAALLAEPETVLLPVLGGDGQLLGVITRREVLNAYRSSIDLPAERVGRPRAEQ